MRASERKANRDSLYSRMETRRKSKLLTVDGSNGVREFMTESFARKLKKGVGKRK